MKRNRQEPGARVYTALNVASKGANPVCQEERRGTPVVCGLLRTKLDHN